MKTPKFLLKLSRSFNHCDMEKTHITIQDIVAIARPHFSDSEINSNNLYVIPQEFGKYTELEYALHFPKSGKMYLFFDQGIMGVLPADKTLEKYQLGDYKRIVILNRDECKKIIIDCNPEKVKVLEISIGLGTLKAIEK